MSAVPSLLEFEQSFATAILSGDNVPVLPWIEGEGLSPDARLQIYRNIVFNTLTGALRTAYPAILQLSGEEFFDGAAARYILTHPSRSGNLQDFGCEFPAFLASLTEAASVPYLAEVARLEWARQQAYLAPDARAVDMSVWQSIAEEQLDSWCLSLHPSVRLIASAFPVLDIWMFCQDPEPGRLQLNSAGQHVLVWRDEQQIAMEELDEARKLWITLLQQGQALGIALREVLARHPDFDLGGAFHWLLQNKLVIAPVSGGPASTESPT